jgi:hypothetical protein
MRYCRIQAKFIEKSSCPHLLGKMTFATCRHDATHGSIGKNYYCKALHAFTRPADLIRTAAKHIFQTGSWANEEIPNCYVGFTNSELADVDGQAVMSHRWKCISCKPDCGFRGRALHMSQTLGRLEYLTPTLAPAHKLPADTRAVKGATPAQWKVLASNRHRCHTLVALQAKFGEAGVRAPSNKTMTKFLRPAAAHALPGEAPEILSRGAMLCFLKSRSLETDPGLLAPTSAKRFVMDAWIPNWEDGSSEWMVAMFRA